MWCRAATLCALLLACSLARAQTDEDRAIERLEALGTLQLGVIRAAGLLGIAADGGEDSPFGGGGLGFALVHLEKRGTAWEGLRLDALHYWSYGSFEVAFTLIDVDQEMIGTDVDHHLCFAALPVIALGDCQYGGVFGLHAQLLSHRFDSESSRWFHRWFELGAVISPFGDSFDADFVHARMPITLGVSLDHVAGVPLPDDEAAVRLRGLAALEGVLRLAGYRMELQAGFDYRPALAPFAADDYALEARLRLAYIWLAPLLGSIKPTAQRIYLELRGSHWQRPWLSDRPALGQNGLEIELGIELSLRGVTPS